MNFIIKVEDKEIELTFIKPNIEVTQAANLYYNRIFKDALASGALLRLKLDKFLRDQGLWDDEREAEYMALAQTIRDDEMILEKGGIKLSDARKIAMRMRETRNKMNRMYSERNALNINTADGQAEQARFNYLLVACVVYKDNIGKTYFKDLNDYLTHSDELNSILIASKFGEFYYGLNEDYEKSLPENKFLTQWKFVDSDLRLINKDGHLVDNEGRLVDEDGRFIDINGNFVDKNGNPVDKEGNFTVEKLPFLDDDNNPIV